MLKKQLFLLVPFLFVLFLGFATSTFAFNEIENEEFREIYLLSENGLTENETNRLEETEEGKALKEAILNDESEEVISQKLEDLNEVESSSLKGAATNYCKISGNYLECSYTVIIPSDIIMYTYLELDWYWKDHWIFQHPIRELGANLSIHRGTRQIRLGDFKGKYQSALTGSVEGRKGYYYISPTGWSNIVYY